MGSWKDSRDGEVSSPSERRARGGAGDGCARDDRGAGGELGGMRRRPDVGSGGQTVRSPAGGACVVSTGTGLCTGVGTAVGATPAAGSGVGTAAAAHTGLGSALRGVDVDLRSVIRTFRPTLVIGLATAVRTPRLRLVRWARR